MAMDQYFTPAWPVERLMERLPGDIPLGGRWLEPCAGHGRIIEVINTLCLENDVDQPEWSAIDIETTCVGPLTEVIRPQDIQTGDFLALTEGMQFGVWDVIISNPPYSIAMEVIQRSCELAPAVIMLLRVSILESEERAAWMQANPPDIYVLPNRPSFVHGKTDNCAYAWMIWYPQQKRDHGRLYILDNTPLAVRKLKEKR